MYNCAAVILRCIESIDYSNSEIIIINDGSTDNGAEIVEQYASNHPNVHLINKRNGGVSSARNLGIQKATGKYLCFVDADDYLSQEGLYRMINLAEQHQADIVKYKITSLHRDTPHVYNSVAHTNTNIELIHGKSQALNRYDISDFHVVDAIFRAETIRNNGVYFHTDLHLHEDDCFMGEFYSVATCVVVTDLPLYNYYTGSYFSHTHNQPIERQRVLIQSGLLAIRHRKSSIAKHCPNQSFPYERLKYMKWVCSVRQAISAHLTLKEYRNLLDEFRKEGVYPLDYSWIKVAGFNYAPKSYIKNIVKTFMVNHPRLCYNIAQLYYKNHK